MNQLYAALISLLLGAAPVLAGDSLQVELRTNIGPIVIELDPEKSPVTVANFLSYVDSGFYEGTIFHRVKPNFMIQGGGMTPDLVEKDTGAPIKNESRNHLHNERGTIAMARTADPNSATAQFYINVRNNLRLDFDYVTRRPGYTVFGRVVEGMDIVEGYRLGGNRTTGWLRGCPYGTDPD